MGESRNLPHPLPRTWSRPILAARLEPTSPPTTSVTTLLDASSRPTYAVDARRQVVYCNAALANWLGMEPERIVGRSVEYHSEPAATGSTKPGSAAALTDLCPPPQALAGTFTKGTVGCVGRSGRLVHRRAEFIPLAADQSAGGVLVLLAENDMSPQELATELTDEPAADELHRVIRRFRRNQAAEFAIETLLGTSAGIRKVRAQVAAAAASAANVLVCGQRGTGREHVARAIHYQAKDDAGKLVPIDCEVASEESIQRACESLRGPIGAKHRHTLLLLNLERLPQPLQAQIRAVPSSGSLQARLVVTLTVDTHSPEREASLPLVDQQLLAAISTITIDLPPLAERIADLPLLSQFFLEAENRTSAKQVGSLRADVLDQLALYRWPGGLDELRGVIAAAHTAATSHEITLADLPTVIHHAVMAAAMPQRKPEKIVLDELLESIERKVVTRALEQSGGNKSAAAELLGMTRPRLYRRLVQLGLVTEAKQAAEELP